MKAAQQMIRLAEIEVNHFVRLEPNLDQVKVFEEIYKAKGPEGLPPIVLFPGKILADGRQRKMAAEHADFESLPFIENPETDYAQQLLISLSYNCAAQPAPTTMNDVYKICKDLLNEGMSRAEVVRSMGRATGWPSEVISKAVAFAFRRWEERKIERAIVAIATGAVTLGDAAKAEGISVDRLRLRLASSKVPHPEGDQPLNKLLEKLAKPFRSLGKSHTNQFRFMQDRVIDGTLTADQVDRIFTYIVGEAKRTLKNLQERQARFESLAKGDKRKGK